MRNVLEEKIVSLWIVDLMARALSTCVDSSKRDALAELAVQIPTVLLHVRTRTRPYDERWVLMLDLRHECVF